MSIVSKPNTFSANSTISSSQVNDNFDTLYNDYNGGISAANLASNSVTTAKIADSNVTTAKIADSNVTTGKIADDAVTAAKVDWASTGSNAGIWWEELGRTTLSGASDSIAVTSIPARKYLMIIAELPNSGQLQVGLRFNNDSTNSYAVRRSVNGAADGTGTSASNIDLFGSQTSQQYLYAYVTNISAQEKIVRYQIVTNQTAGAANNPDRGEGAGKWANTSTQITEVDVINTGTGDFATGAEVVVLGHN